MVVAAHGAKSYSRWLEESTFGVSFAAESLSPMGQFGGPPTSGGPMPEGHMATPKSLLDALKEGEDNQSPWQPGKGGPYKWDNLPSEPVEDDPSIMPPVFGPPPPPTNTIPGYESVGFREVISIPPPHFQSPQGSETPQMSFDSVANLKEDECRDAMLTYVRRNFCYGKACAEHMKVDKILPSSGLHYTLETFCESRIVAYVHVPYSGGPVDGPENGAPLLPWQLSCKADAVFQNDVKKVEVPHTCIVQPCHACQGQGFIRCHRCKGLGQVKCSRCQGQGHIKKVNTEGQPYTDSCNFCGGDGLKRCYTCGGDSRLTCSECQGWRNIKVFIQLTVTFDTHRADHIAEKTDIPEKLIRLAPQKLIFEQVLPQVCPIVSYPLQEINYNSGRLVEAHRNAFHSERQLLQRQQLRAVPVTEVHYTWKGVVSKFWVYGDKHKVYAPDYPETCCWGCNIL